LSEFARAAKEENVWINDVKSLDQAQEQEDIVVKRYVNEEERRTIDRGGGCKRPKIKYDTIVLG